tara:strand:- start:37 stop:696 length:660 start_codon:yes stop_codon:yes gene_type:complete
VVDDKMFIIDGQHRYTALKELNLPVEFILSTRSGDTMKDKMSVMESQNTSFSWTNMEKLELRSKIDDNYLRLKNLTNEYGFGLSTTCEILFNAKAKLKAGKVNEFNIGFAENTMIVTEEMVLNSKYRFQKFKELRKINKSLACTKIVRIIISLSKNQKLNLDVLLEKSIKYKHKVEDLFNSNTTLDFVEKLYNYNSKNKTYFLDPKKFYGMRFKKQNNK